MLMPSRHKDLPGMLRCRQKLYRAALDKNTLPGMIEKQARAAELTSRINPGDTVAVAAGSRGIDGYAAVVREVVQWLIRAGAKPFVFPAMGSHGGATADGQRHVLEVQGITEEYVGCPIQSGMDVVELGRIPEGLPVYLDACAAKADALIVVNRVKVHTNFRGELESGLCKMLAIGTGKHAQAIAIHSYGVVGLRDYMPQIAKTVIEKAPVVAGFAILEDAEHRLCNVVGIRGDLIPIREAELLNEVRKYTPSLPVNDLDLLIIDTIGKYISGTGIDTNVVGRCRLLDLNAFDQPRIRTITAHDLRDDSHGNALGVGLADLIPRRLADKIDPKTTAINCITGLSPQLGAVPITLDTDEEVIRTALDYFCAHKPREQVSVIRIRDSLSLSEMLVSESLMSKLESDPSISLEGPVKEIGFDDSGNLVGF